MLEKVDGKQELCRFDGVGSVTVYLGSLGGMMEKLEDVTDKVKWHKEYCEPMYMDIRETRTMTVKELIKELRKCDKNADVCMGVAAYGEFWGVEDVVGTEGGSRVLLLDGIAPPWFTDENGIRGFIV